MGEFELLARVRERLPPPGPRVLVGAGDDAAVTVPGGATATSVDAVVEGGHFHREHASLRQVGIKALATALSDLAAMGAEPGEAYAVLGVPVELSEDQCVELLDGIVELAAGTGTTLAGGDLIRCPALTLAITVVGHASIPERLVTRSGARPGDALVLTGALGAAAAGLILLDRSEEAAVIPAATTERLLARQLEPSPRLAAGRALAAAGATAMIDLSDGLGGDAGHLAWASGVGLWIDAEAIPLEDGVAELAAIAGQDPLQLAVSGGEDYELLATIPAAGLDLTALASEAGVPVTRIGEAVAGSGVEIRLPGGRSLEPGGYDQLG
ncbi:MAG: thiamine-phosphate kinase [Solirubrobacterales bacterium]